MCESISDTCTCMPLFQAISMRHVWGYPAGAARKTAFSIIASRRLPSETGQPGSLGRRF